MISLVIGLGNIGIGLAYAGLGLLSAWETFALHRYRGWSRFGLGFSLMAASCGPHHLAHGWSVLRGESVTWTMFAVTLLGLPSGLIFVWLRLEAMWDGHGDRRLKTSAEPAMALAGGFLMAAGGLASSAFAQRAGDFPYGAICTSAGSAGVDFTSLTFITNAFVTLTYGLVGWYLADRQVRRYLTSGGWSLSGVALTGVFFTCAEMHIVDATTNGSAVMLFFDLLGVPASIYFLRVVKQLHNDSVMDWNRRPLVGAAAAPARPSPWSAESAIH